MDRLDRILVLVRSHVPALRLVNKADVPWMRVVGRVVAPVMPDFSTQFTTVLGDTVYLPRALEDFPRDKLAATLAHELVHQLDQRRWGAMFYVSYGLLLPSLRSTRAHWERRAYVVDLMLARERGGEPEQARVLEWLVDLFSGASYGWMWAGRDAARAFLLPVETALAEGTLQREEPYASILAAWRGV
jgi:hypothetical protein